MEENRFENLSAGRYTLQLRDSLNCTSDSSLVIYESNCPIYIPKAFSPNGDGLNEYFQPIIAEEANIRIQNFEIRDRLGNLLFRRSPYDGLSLGWDGRANAGLLNPGVYVISSNTIDYWNNGS